MTRRPTGESMKGSEVAATADLLRMTTDVAHVLVARPASLPPARRVAIDRFGPT